MKVLYILLAVVLLIVIAVIALYNKIVRAKNDVAEGFSTMDVQMKRRCDLIPNLVSAVKGYSKHEAETLEKTVAARYAAMNSGSLIEQAQAENALQSTLKSIFSLTESYPDLKASANFMDLQNKLELLEKEIASSRKYYNATVKNFNNTIMVFPNSIIAKMFSFTKVDMFEIAEDDRKIPKVEF